MLKDVKIIYMPTLICLFFCKRACGTCFFSQDMQGRYLTQSTVSRGPDIDYKEVNITQDSISIWGLCHRRFGNNVILYDMVNDMECMRCFHIVARSRHILEIHTEGLGRCYTNEGAALTKCPTEQRIKEHASVEIMLYKVHNLLNNGVIQPVYCPIEGSYRATYDINDGTEAITECPSADSHFSNCPKGNRLTISFKRCTFSDFSKSFECLGFWNTSDGETFLALRDPSIDHETADANSRSPPAPKYRCAVFRREWPTGRIFVSFSSDSTCFNNLRSPWEGFESMVLEPQAKPHIPQIVNESACSFPVWAQGKWEHLDVQGGVMTYTDLQEFKTFSVHCVRRPSASSQLFPVYSQSQCGDERFSCLSIQERSQNVIEFRILKDGNPHLMPDLCTSKLRMDWPQWITQGRVDRFRESPCPVAGEYIGTIPDEKTLCAKLYSDCNNLEIMFYTVYPCSNRSSIYEEREYRCLGQWEESGVTYTYTERRDVTGYECFAGVVMAINEIFIIEAGTNCERGLKPFTSGMKLTKQATCQNAFEHPHPSEKGNPAWSNDENRSPEVNNSVIGDTLPTSSVAARATGLICIYISIVIYFIIR